MKIRILPALLITLTLAMPIAASAQSTDLQSQIIALLTQIITLQKTLIENLQNQITQLSQLRASQPPISSLINTHTCSIINPPACSTTLTVTRDSYNCVTGYSCAAAPVATPAPTVATSASCTGYSGKVYANGTRADNCDELLNPIFYQACEVSAHLAYVGPICRNGQWVSTTQSTGASCTYNGQTYVEGRTYTADIACNANMIYGGECGGRVTRMCRSGQWINQ